MVSAFNGGSLIPVFPPRAPLRFIRLYHWLYHWPVLPAIHYLNLGMASGSLPPETRRSTWLEVTI